KMSILAFCLLIVQVGLGGLTVRHELSAWIVVAHLGTAMAFFAMLVTIATTALLGSEPGVRSHESRIVDGFWKLALLTLAATYALILIGGYVSATGAGLACPDWPLCYGRLLPSLQGPVAVHFYHRVVAAVVSLLIISTAVVAYRTQSRRPQLLAATAIAVGLLILQVILGALNVEYRLADPVTTAHLATAAALFATLVALVVLARHVPEVEPEWTAGSERSRRVARVLDYVALTKPRIMILLLVTTLAAMLIAAPGQVSPWVILATLVGGAMASGSASAINQLLERDIDALMARTRRRPVAAGRVQPPFAFAFATLLGFAAFAVLAAFVNLLSAVLAMGGLLFYVFVYTVWLKRLTPQNIVIGGAAGAVPPLVGWAAATGRIELPALILFLIVFLWTPPHFWALSLYRRDDYARAGLPMLPVVAGEDVTRRQIVLYTVGLVAVSLLLHPLGGLGRFYVVAAALAGGCFLLLAVGVWRQKTARSAVRLFGYSILYLGLLFGAMVLDRLLGVGPGA
ncbi:MAG TPA: heme o synthase, partial [bacterium]